MFKSKPIFQRVFFALVLLAIIIPTFIINKFLGDAGRITGLTFFSLVAILGAYEVNNVILKNKTIALFGALITIIPAMIFPFDELKLFIMENGYRQNLLSSIKFLFTWKWLLIPLMSSLIIIFTTILLNSKFQFNQFLFVLINAYISIFFAKSIWIISTIDLWFVIFIISITIISDTTAYFGGMLFGKKWFKGAKLMPKVSPKKTIAGFVVSIFFTVIFTILTGYYINFWEGTNNTLIISIIAGICLSIIAPFGDLLYSLIKRKYQVKDFSNLIPGHGGIFDRVDSLSVVVVFTSLIFIFF